MTSYTKIRDRLKFDHDLPFTPDWSATEDFLDIIIDYCLNYKPGNIIECSSGLSTIILARCCQLNQQGKVYSLENGAEYAGQTRKQLIEFGLQDYATVIDAPLEEVSINGEKFLWYSRDLLPTEAVDMLVIDGPSGFIQKNSRYPALPLLIKQFAERVSVFLDDAARDDEKDIVELWQKDYPQFQHEYINTERGCSVLTKK